MIVLVYLDFKVDLTVCYFSIQIVDFVVVSIKILYCPLSILHYRKPVRRADHCFMDCFEPDLLLNFTPLSLGFNKLNFCSSSYWYYWPSFVMNLRPRSVEIGSWLKPPFLISLESVSFCPSQFPSEEVEAVYFLFTTKFTFFQEFYLFLGFFRLFMPAKWSSMKCFLMEPCQLHCWLTIYYWMYWAGSWLHLKEVCSICS